MERLGLIETRNSSLAELALLSRVVTTGSRRWGANEY